MPYKGSCHWYSPGSSFSIVIKAYCCSLLFFLLPLVLPAQISSVAFKEVTVEVSGEKVKIFKDLVQDQDGFIWLNSRGRLIRYDGYDAKVYEYIPGDSTSLLPGELEGLYVDHTGSLWVGNPNGVSRYVSGCDCFVHYRFEPNHLTPGGLLSTTIRTFTEDPEYNLWVGKQGGGVYRYDRANDLFISYLDDPEDSNSIVKDIVRVLLADRKGNIWIGTGYGPPEMGGGLIRFTPSTGEVKRFLHDPADSHSLLDNRVSALMEDQEGTIWVGTYQCGLHRFNPDTEDFVRMMSDPDKPDALHAPCKETDGFGDGPFVQILHQDQRGDYWVGTLGVGINHFNAREGKLRFINPADGPFNFLWALYEDRQGHLWLTHLASGEGLFKLDVFAKEVHFYPGFTAVEVSCESQLEPGILWISTARDGLQRLNINTGAITAFVHDEQDNRSLATNAVQVAYEDREGTLWVGLGGRKEIEREDGDGGLARLDRSTNTFIHYNIYRDDTTDFRHTVYAIAEDRTGSLWLSIRDKTLLRFDKDQASFKRYHFPGSNENTRIYLPDNLEGDAIWALDYNEELLYQYNRVKDNFSPFLQGYKVMTVLEEDNGWFWIATREKGLLHYNREDGNIEQYTVQDGLPSNEVADFRQDASGILWIVTTRGIVRFDPVGRQFDRTGLPQSAYIRYAFKNRDDQLFFGAYTGLYSFHREDMKGNFFPPEVLLTRLEISGKFYDLPDDTTRKLSFSHQQNTFRIEYLGLHYSNPANNRYQYKLSPYDDEWVDAGTQRSARYTNLDPGQYTFQVKAANSDGYWTEKGASLSFVIHPPWWQSWWAYVGFTALLAVMLYAFYAYRRRQWMLQHQLQLEQREAERLKELNVMKTQLYTNITHEFRTPLTVISGMADQVLENPKDWFRRGLNMIKRNSGQLLGLINQMLDLSKLEAGTMPVHLVQDDIIRYLRYLTESLHAYAESKDIRLHFLPAVRILQMDFDPDKLQTIFINLVGNGIKFTPIGGDIYISVSEIQDPLLGPSLELEVKDNGIGIPAMELPHIFNRFYQVDGSSTRKNEGTGIGLALTLELVKLLGGSIDVKSEEGEGAAFIILLPIKHDAAAEPVETVFQNGTVSTALVSKTARPTTEMPIGDTELPLVLLIEDHKDVLQYFFACLQGQYRLEMAVDGEEGISKAIDLVPDIIISDVMMPGKDGFEVVATLKKDIRTSHIPIILLTAKVDLAARLEGLERGADAYLAKPFERKELEVRVRKLIESRQQLSARYATLSPADGPANPAQQQEDAFLQKLRQIVEARIEEEDFSIPLLCREMGVSRTQLHRKLKALTNKSTSQVIRTIRMQRAKILLQQGELNVSEVGYAVGYASPSHFSQEFTKEFGEAPSLFRNNGGNTKPSE